MNYLLFSLLLCVSQLSAQPGTLEHIRTQIEQGNRYLKKGKYRQADYTLTQARKTLSDKHLTTKEGRLAYAAVEHALGELYGEMDNTEKSLSCLQNAVTLRAELLGVMHPDYAESAIYLSAIYLQQGEIEKGQQLINQATEVFRVGMNRSTLAYANYLATLGGIAIYFLQNYSKAVTYMRMAMETVQKRIGKETPEYVEYQYLLFLCYENSGHYTEALSLYQELKPAMDKYCGEEHPRQASLLCSLSNIQTKQGEYADARMSLLKARIIVLKSLGKQHSRYREVLNALAVLYTATGSFDKAEECLKEILEERTGKEEDTYNIANAYNNLGILSMKRADYIQAEAYFIQALQMLSPDERNVVTGTEILSSIAFTYTQQAHLARLIKGQKPPTNRPLAYWQKSFPWLFNTPEEPDYLIPQKERDQTVTESLLLKALHKQHKVVGRSNTNYTTLLGSLGGHYFLNGRYPQADICYQKALELLQQSKDKADTNAITLQRNRAWVLDIMGQYDAALPLYRQSFDTLQKLMNNNFLSLSEKERELFWEQHYLLINRALSMAVKSTGNPEFAAYAFDCVLFGKGLLLTSSQALSQAVEKQDNPKLTFRLRMIQQTKAQLTKFREMTSDIKQEQASINEAEMSMEEAEKKLIELIPALLLQSTPTRWQQVKEVLTAQEVAIELAYFDDFNYSTSITGTKQYCALLVAADWAQPIAVPLCTEEELIRVLLQYGFTSREVGDLLWKPLEKYLNGRQHIYLAPAGLTHNISFAGLRQAEGYLGDRYIFHNLLSTRDLLALKSRQPSPRSHLRAVLYGGADYQISARQLAALDPQRGTGFSYLPGSLQEVQAIQKILARKHWKTELYTDTEATGTSFLALSSSPSPELIHLSTHGFYFPQPEKPLPDYGGNINGTFYKRAEHPLLRSGLLFAGANQAWNAPQTSANAHNGILTALDISTMDLSNTRLVVLSACNTGQGDSQTAEGVFGLQRAFRLAGAQAMIVSLWPVSDRETPELMQDSTPGGAAERN